MTKISDLQHQVKSLDENWKRSLADYQNLLRRAEQDRKDYSKLANANLIARLLPSLDIINLSASHSKDLGMEMAAKQFKAALKEEGLEEISPIQGDHFDASIHDCSETVPGDQDDTIAEVILPGYKMGDFVLRPAKVKVFKLALDK